MQIDTYNWLAFYVIQLFLTISPISLTEAFDLLCAAARELFLCISEMVKGLKNELTQGFTEEWGINMLHRTASPWSISMNQMWHCWSPYPIYFIYLFYSYSNFY